MSKGGGISLRRAPAHSALLGATPTLPSLHIRATLHVHLQQDFVNYSSLSFFFFEFVCVNPTYSFPPLNVILSLYTLKI